MEWCGGPAWNSSLSSPNLFVVTDAATFRFPTHPRTGCHLVYFACITIAINSSIINIILVIHPPQDDHQSFARQLEDKRPVVDGNLANGRQYVANEVDVDEQNRELVRSIRREVGKLGEQWHGLLERSEQWKRHLDDLVTVSGSGGRWVVGPPLNKSSALFI